MEVPVQSHTAHWPSLSVEYFSLVFYSPHKHVPYRLVLFPG
jgi:hypothetical protein